MRPYMLWLARGGTTHWLYLTPVAGKRLDALGDWIKYQSELRFMVEAGRR